MKRILSLALSLCLVLGLCACGGSNGSSVPGWKEQYDLGVRYLTEGSYEEAILAFTAAIEIDPKQPDAYIGLAEVHVAQGDKDKASEVLTQAETVLGEHDALSAAWQNLLGMIGRERTENEDGSYSISYNDSDGNHYYGRYYAENDFQVYGYDADDRRIYERYANEDQDHACWCDYDGTQVTVTVACYRDSAWSECADTAFADGPITAFCTYVVADPSHNLSAHGNEAGHGDNTVSIWSISIDEYTADWEERVAEAEISTDPERKQTWKCTYSGNQATMEVTAWSPDQSYHEAKVIHYTMQSSEHSIGPGYGGGSHCAYGGTGPDFVRIVAIKLREYDTNNNIINEEEYKYS